MTTDVDEPDDVDEPKMPSWRRGDCERCGCQFPIPWSDLEHYPLCSRCLGAITEREAAWRREKER